MVAAVVHLIGHIAGPAPAANDTEQQLFTLMTSYHFALPGGSERTMTEFMSGYSLACAVLFATIGVLGLVVAKRGQHDSELMYVTARTSAIASAAVLIISLMYFFIVPTMLLAAVTLCFAVSAVRAPGQ